MPIREYVCRQCRTKVESIEYGDPCLHLCIDCGLQMDQVEFSVPARVTPGTYGKGCGRVVTPESE